jgi:nucleoside-diphosphate kinase
MFLKRMAYAGIDQANLYIGAIVTIYSRQLKLVEYGDQFTRNMFANAKETTFALIKPDAYVHTGKIIDQIYKAGFVISNLKMGRFTAATTARFLQHNNQKGEEFSAHLMSDVSTGMELVASNACEKGKALADSIQRQFGAGTVRNAFHASTSADGKKEDLGIFFGGEIQSPALFTNCTCVVIKPHVVAAG